MKITTEDRIEKAVEIMTANIDKASTIEADKFSGLIFKAERLIGDERMADAKVYSYLALILAEKVAKRSFVFIGN